MRPVTLTVIGVGILAILAFAVLTGDPQAAPSATGSVTEDPESTGSVSSQTAESPQLRDPVETPATPPSEYVEIQVVRKRDGEPVPGAEVLFLDGPGPEYDDDDPDGRMELTYLRYDDERYLRRFGETVVADGEGRAWVPRGRPVSGRYENLYGELQVRTVAAGDSPQKLELTRDYSLSVQVLRPDGSPAVGVPVVLVPLDDRPNISFSHFNSLDLARTEAPDGIAVIGHLQDSYGRFLSGDQEAKGWEVRYRVPGWTGGGAEVDPWDPPDEAVVLTLPPTGTVYVRGLDLDGNPVPLIYAYELLVKDEAGDTLGGWSRGVYDGTTQRFDWVVAGRTYTASSVGPRDRFERVFAGPGADGDIVRVDLPLDPDNVVLLGRAVDSENRPLANEQLSLSIETSYGGGGDTIRTDEQGRIRLFLYLARNRAVIDYIQLTARDPERIAVLRDMGPFPAGRTDIGDLVFREPEVVVSGRVLLDGEPYPERVPLRIEAWSEGSGEWSFLPHMLVERQEFPGDGSFAVRGDVPPGRYRLFVDLFRSLPLDPVPFTRGQTDLVVALQSGATLTVDLVADDGMEGIVTLRRDSPVQPSSQADVRAAAEADMRLHSEASLHPSQRSSSFPTIPTGPYRLEVGTHVDPDPLVVRALDLVAGENRVEVDLRGRLREMEVVAFGSGDVVFTTGTGSSIALVRLPGGEPVPYELVNSRFRIVTTAPVVDVLVAARGFRAREVTGLSADLRLELEPHPSVEVRLHTPPVLPPGASVSVELLDAGRARKSEESPWGPWAGRILFYSAPARFAADGRAVLHVPDGRYEVRLRAALEGRGARIGDLPLPELTVDHASARDHFELDLPQDALDRTLAELRRR